jgi:hypothetical protein
MKTNISAALALSATIFALTVESAESMGQESDAKRAVMEHTVIANLSTYRPTQSKSLVPRVSILDKPIKLKIDILPFVHSERSSELSFDWLK